MSISDELLFSMVKDMSKNDSKRTKKVLKRKNETEFLVVLKDVLTDCRIVYNPDKNDCSIYHYNVQSDLARLLVQKLQTYTLKSDIENEAKEYEDDGVGSFGVPGGEQKLEVKSPYFSVYDISSAVNPILRKNTDSKSQGSFNPKQRNCSIVSYNGNNVGNYSNPIIDGGEQHFEFGER